MTIKFNNYYICPNCGYDIFNIFECVHCPKCGEVL